MSIIKIIKNTLLTSAGLGSYITYLAFKRNHELNRYLNDNDKVVIIAKKMAEKMGINPENIRVAEDEHNACVYFNLYTWSYIIKISSLFTFGEILNVNIIDPHTIKVKSITSEATITSSTNLDKLNHLEIAKLFIHYDCLEFVIAHELSHIANPFNYVKSTFYQVLGNLTQSRQISKLLHNNELKADTLAIKTFPHLSDQGLKYFKSCQKLDRLFGTDNGKTSYSHPSIDERINNLLNLK